MTAKKTDVPPDAADREIVITRVFDAPRERVWEAWADPKQVVQWWGPRGFSTTSDQREFKTGGAWRHTMIGPDGTKYPNFSRFEEIVKPERIVYTHGGNKEGGEGISFRQTVTFKDLGGGRTELTMRQVFSTAELRERVVKEFGAVEGGKQTLERLSEHLAGVEKPAFELILTRLIDAPRERVFQAWADPKQVTRWFAPKPYTLPRCKLDLCTGGSFDMAMRSPEGVEHAFSGKYLEVIPSEKIVWSGEFPGEPKDQMHTTVTFEDAVDGKTRLTVRQIFRVLTPTTVPHTKGARQGWTATLDQLSACVEEKR